MKAQKGSRGMSTISLTSALYGVGIRGRSEKLLCSLQSFVVVSATVSKVVFVQVRYKTRCLSC